MLSKKVKYAFLALDFIIRRRAGEPIKIHEIAEGAQLPRKFLEGILADLKKAGILESRRGWSGGYILRKKPSEISYGDIVRILDGPLQLTTCSLSSKRCAECGHLRRCPFRDGFQRANHQLIKSLQTIKFGSKKPDIVK